MKNVLVTGGAGYIGSHTVVELIAAGYRPVIVDNFSNSQPEVLEGLKAITGQEITCYKQDYQDKGKLLEILKSESIDSVIHFAASKSVGESVDMPLEYYKNNVAGLISLLETLTKQGIDNLVFSSTCAVYGEADSLPITEDSPIKPPVSPYGATKQMGETIIRDTTRVSSGLKSLSLRYFNPIGAHPSSSIGELPQNVPTTLVPLIAQATLGKRDKLMVFGDDYDTPDGSCIRDYIHVVDLAKAHVKALEYLDRQQAKSYNVVNVGTGTGNTVLEIIETFQKVVGRKVPYEIGPRRPGDIVKNYASIDKAKSVLGWQPEKTLEDALIDAWHWQQYLGS